MAAKTLLNNVDHQDLRVVPRFGAEFGDSVNQMLVFPTEYEEVQREFPIFLRKDEQDEYQSVALLGLDKDENLFLGPSGWQSRYIPAIQARGPFSIGLSGSVDGRPEPMIHVDLDDPRVSLEGGPAPGLPVFLAQGGNSPYLEGVTEALKRLYTGLDICKPLFDALEANALIEQVNVEIKLGETRQYELNDYFTISQAALLALDGAALERLNKAGFLRAAYMIAASVANVNHLIALKNRQPEAQ